MIKILAFAGSLRQDSVNKKLIKYAALELAKLGVEVTFIDLKDYPLPVYNPDILAEEIPHEAKLLSNIMMSHQVWLIASPEYNYSITSCMKNLIDWMSRIPNNQPNMTAFADRVIGLVSASPSTYGGFRSLRQLREIFSSLGSFVVPSQVCVPNAFSAFDEQGHLTDVMGQKMLATTLNQLVSLAEKLK